MSRNLRLLALIFLLSVTAFLLRDPIINWFREFREDKKAIAMFDLFLGGINSRLMGELNPDLPQNQYMPKFLLERLRWVKERKANGKLLIRLQRESWIGRHKGMGAEMRDGVMYIYINSSLLLEYNKYKSGDEHMRRGIRSSITISLAHETLHFEEILGNHLYKDRPFLDIIEEEMFIRAVINVNATQPLVEKGEAIMQDEYTTMLMLLKCENLWPTCVEYRNWVADLYKSRLVSPSK